MKMAVDRRLFVLVLLISLYAVRSERADDCLEVGFARSGGGLPSTSYDAVRKRVLQRWREEDSKGRPPYTHFTGSLKNVTRAAYLLEEVSKEIVSSVHKTRVGKRCKKEWLLRGVEKHVRPLLQLDQKLADDLGLVMSFRCMVGSPYPNVDGTCVSEESPDMGAIGSKFLRLLPAIHGGDGFSLREGSGSGLPNARSVANLLRAHLQQPAVTRVFRDWGHFLQQDAYSIPESPYTEGVDCCKSPDAEDCCPILVPEDDPLHEEMPCINFRRSARAQAILGHRESFSLVSTYLDATPLYGPTNEVAFKKKTGYFGYLKGSKEEEDAAAGGSDCKAPESWEGCFQLDESANVTAGVRALLLLEHNRIADALAELNPHFDDALLYNEARRILLAEYTAVTYSEYLPVLMGEDTVVKHSLRPGSEGPAASYIKDVNPGILTSFAVAAFRNPSMLTEWDQTDAGRSELLETSHYSSVADQPYQDLLALDVQRGRDHGLPGYQSWRRFCEPGLVLDSWDDLKKVLPEEAVSKLQKLYSDRLEDVDAMAALLEPPLEGAVSGRTFTCIMADQFARLRTGNRLYWEHAGGLLTKEQLTALRGVRLVSLLCNNLPVTAVPANPFLPVSDENPRVECADVTPLNLTHWTDTSLIETMKQDKKIQKSEVSSEKSDSKSSFASDKSTSDDAAPSSSSSSSSAQCDACSSSTVSAVIGEAREHLPTDRMTVVGEGASQHLTTAKIEL